MLESLTKKQKIIFFIILIIMISIIIYYIYSTLYTNDFSYNTQTLIQESTNISTTEQETLEANYIVVYICGEVKESKVLTLKENSRICDAIDAVGGLTENADLTNINLAYILEDGEKIYIPKKGEAAQTENNSNSSSQMSSYIYNSSKTTKININKATQTELETIPGIGPSSALKIINYREENGKFKSIEDIKNVSGIGDKKFESIKDYITVK